jgi:CBS domain-containing protein
LRAAGEHFQIAARETEAWIAAFYYLQGQRLQRQVSCIDRGEAPDNKLNPAVLHDYERECLRAAFEQARNIQSRLALDYST